VSMDTSAPACLRRATEELRELLGGVEGNAHPFLAGPPMAGQRREA